MCLIFEAKTRAVAWITTNEQFMTLRHEEKHKRTYMRVAQLDLRNTLLEKL